MFEWLLVSLQQLDLFSMGTGIILMVIAFAIWYMKVWKKKANKDNTIIKK
jgi:ABC-type nickel/cobalt efflux system permease component RcnA